MAVGVGGRGGIEGRIGTKRALLGSSASLGRAAVVNGAPVRQAAPRPSGVQLTERVDDQIALLWRRVWARRYAEDEGAATRARWTIKCVRRGDCSRYQLPGLQKRKKKALLALVGTVSQSASSMLPRVPR